MSYRGYEAVIGIEIHVQLSTQTKIFCADSTKFDAADNENTSPVSVGMPGTLPVLNKKAVEFAAKMGMAKATAIILFNSGDASIDAAMRNGGITKVHHVNYDVKNIFFLFFTEII